MRLMRAVHSHAASRWLTLCGRGLALTILWCSLLAATVVAADDDDYATRRPSMPPGQESLIAGMLGRGMLIRGCRLASGGVEYTVIKATYDCPRGEVALEISHLLDATAPSAQIGQFAITIQSGSPPSGFEEALVSRVRSRQNQFVWTWPEPAPVQGDDGAE
jgi:hypothetical protein